MTEISNAARELRNAYYRAWRKRNPDKVKENNRRYWENRLTKETEKQSNSTDKGEKG
ncbi:MAG: hypothetical protein K5771_03120 [Oscillospiraceae bacterium]|nr:hypothetical protein [Oscillospiraceae bacterium]